MTGSPGQLSLAPTFRPPTAPSSPATLSHSIIVPPVPPQSKLVLVFPLQEVSGVDGLVRVNVSFSLFELSQVEKRFGSHTANTSSFIKNSSTLLNPMTIPFTVFNMILASNLLPEKNKQVWSQTRTMAHTDELHKTDITYTVGTRSVPDQDPEWDYNTPGDILARN